jgi:hypothetical protein
MPAPHPQDETTLPIPISPIPHAHSPPSPTDPKSPLGPVLLIILAFRFQDQVIAIGKPDDKVRVKLSDHAFVIVENRKAQVIVLDERVHQVGFIQGIASEASHPLS